MSKFKLQITPVNGAFALALLGLGVLHFWKPELMGRAENFVLFAAALLGAQAPQWFVRVEQAIEVLPSAPKPPRVPPLAVLVLFMGVMSTALVTGGEACTPQEQQQAVTTSTPATACVLAIIGDVTNAPDIAKTAATCGVTAADIWTLVQSLLAAQPDAGALAASPSSYVAHLHAWADALKAAGAK